MSDKFDIFTSIRYDVNLKKAPTTALVAACWNVENESPLYMLDFHRDRMLQAATHWKWQAAVDALSGIEGIQNLAMLVEEMVGPSQSTPMRLKILASASGEIRCEMGNTPEVSLENLLPSRLPPPGSSPLKGDPRRETAYTLLVDHARTLRSEFTHYKTTRRDMYDGARQRARISLTDMKEVLTVNRADGSVMEGTITTPYFWRDGQWITPPVSAAFSLEDGSGGQKGTSRRWALEMGLAKEQVIMADSLVDGEECWLSNGIRGFIWAKISLSDTQI
ncbi:aminotransferase [Mariannaea sp. PMI_226]|nr:aminotransferase [Mariannaea sp. PMI_226]